MPGGVILSADTGVVGLDQIHLRGSRCSQVTFESEVVRSEDIDRTGRLEDVVVAFSTDGRKAIADRHVKAEPVIGLGITCTALGHTLQTGRAAVEQEVAQTRIVGLVVITWSAYCEQVSIEVNGSTESVTGEHGVRNEVVGLCPAVRSTAPGEQFKKGDRTAVVQAVEIGPRRTCCGPVTADGDIRTESVIRCVAKESPVQVPTLVVPFVEVNSTGIGAGIVIAPFTNDHPVSGNVEGLSKALSISIDCTLGSDEARLEPHVEQWVVLEVVYCTGATIAVLGTGAHHHAVAIHGQSFSEAIGIDGSMRGHVAQHTFILPIQAIELVHVHGTRIGTEGVIESSPHGNPITIGGQGMAAAKIDVRSRGRQGGLQGPGAVHVAPEHFHHLGLVGCHEHIAMDGDRGTEMMLYALLGTHVFVVHMVGIRGSGSGLGQDDGAGHDNGRAEEAA